MTEFVVDTLEAVDVDGADGEALARDGRQHPVELTAVAQPGEGIGGGDLGQPGHALAECHLGAAPLLDVAELSADVDHHLNRRGPEPCGPRTKEGDDPDHEVVDEDGEAHAGGQASGGRSVPKPGVGGEVGDDHGCRGRPDPPR